MKVNCYWRKRHKCDIWDFVFCEMYSTDQVVIATLELQGEEYFMKSDLLGFSHPVKSTTLEDCKIDVEMEVISTMRYYQEITDAVIDGIVLTNELKKTKS